MLSQILDFFVTFLILTISRKYLHIWGPMDPLSLSASVILFIAVVQEMSHFGTLCDVCDYTTLLVMARLIWISLDPLWRCLPHPSFWPKIPQNKII